MQNNIEQSTDIRSLYARASIVVFGGVCAVLMANLLYNLTYNGTGYAIFSRFRFMAGLCYPILYFWIGLLLRARKQNPKWWVQLIVLCLSLFCLYYYRHFAQTYKFFGFLYFASTGFGFLAPSKVFVQAKHYNGWLSLIMIILAVFCYTVIEFVKSRLLWGPIIPNHPDMEVIMELLLVNAEPLMVLITIYFVTQFAFSRIAQYLGSQSWFRGLIAIPCTFTFYVALSRTLATCNEIYIMISGAYIVPFLWLICQPITIYLFIVGYRYIRERRKKKEDRQSWKEMLRID